MDVYVGIYIDKNKNVYKKCLLCLLYCDFKHNLHNLQDELNHRGVKKESTTILVDTVMKCRRNSSIPEWFVKDMISK